MVGEKQSHFHYLKRTLCVPSNVIVWVLPKKVRFALICKKKNMTHFILFYKGLFFVTKLECNQISEEFM